MDVVVLVKQVPDTYSERRLRGGDWTLDRGAVDAVIDEIDTRGVEAALGLVDAHGGEVTVVSMGPAGAVDSLRKALAMGAHRAVHVLDEGLAGSCAVQTSVRCPGTGGGSDLPRRINSCLHPASTTRRPAIGR